MTTNWCWYKNRDALYQWRVLTPELLIKKSDWALSRFAFDAESFSLQQVSTAAVRGGTMAIPFPRKQVDPFGPAMTVQFRDVSAMRYRGRRIGSGGQLRIETDAGVIHVVRDVDLYNLRGVFNFASPLIQKIRQG